MFIPCYPSSYNFWEVKISGFVIKVCFKNIVWVNTTSDGPCRRKGQKSYQFSQPSKVRDSKRKADYQREKERKIQEREGGSAVAKETSIWMESLLEKVGKLWMLASHILPKLHNFRVPPKHLTQIGITLVNRYSWDISQVRGDLIFKKAKLLIRPLSPINIKATE